MKMSQAAALLASLLAAGCSTTAPPDVLPFVNPADPALGTRGISYRPVLGDYSHRRPVDPSNWRQLNDRLSPAKKGEGA